MFNSSVTATDKSFAIDHEAFCEQVQKNGVVVNCRSLTKCKAKVISSIPDLEINATTGKYIVPPQLFMQFGWCTPNSHNAHNLVKVSTYRKIWDPDCVLTPGNQLTKAFIDDFNEIMAKELRMIKQQGMECALKQSIEMCNKFGFTMSDDFGGRAPRTYKEIYSLLTNEARKKEFNKDCVAYFETIYKIVHAVFKEDVDWLGNYVGIYAQQKSICLDNIVNKKKEGQRLHFLCKVALSSKLTLLLI